MQAITLIVPFEVPHGQESEFRQQWHRVAEPFSHAPGFRSAQLYEVSNEVEQRIKQLSNMKWVGEQRFRFVNIAKWDSLAHYQAAIQSSHQGRTIAFRSYPAYYRLAFKNKENSLASEHPKTGKEFTFIIPFEVPNDQDDEMRRQFQAVVAAMSKGGPVKGSLGPGLYEIDTETDSQMRSFLSTQLQNGISPEIAFRFINVAEWASIEDYEAIMRSRTHVTPITFNGHGTYYRIAHEYNK